MAKSTGPLIGYNNNVRYRGRAFHIQTEDSGTKFGHVVTHLFVDGGRILHTLKNTYADHVGTEGVDEIVRAMMQNQHKAMFSALRDGEFDGMLTEGGPLPPARASQLPPSLGRLDPEPLEEHESTPPPTIRSEHPTLTDAAAHSRSHAAMPPPPVDHLPPRSAPMGSSIVRESDLPPPPSNLLRRNTPTGTTYRASRAAHDAPPDDAVYERAASSTLRTSSPGAFQGERFQPSSAAAIFTRTRHRVSREAFAEALRAESTLDDVLIAYLAPHASHDGRG